MNIEILCTDYQKAERKYYNRLFDINKHNLHKKLDLLKQVITTHVADVNSYIHSSNNSIFIDLTTSEEVR